MNNGPEEEWRKLPLALRLSDEELDLLRWIGARMSRLLLGRFEELPFLDRGDELGILVNMIARVTKELGRAKERDLAQKKKLEAQKKELETQKQELEIRVTELEVARAEAARLLETVRKLTAPVLKVHRGVMLVPIAGALDTELLSRVEERVLLNVGVTNARVVILDITGARVIEPEIAQGLVRIARAVSLLGARVILCGVSAAAARTAVEQGLDFTPAILRSDLAGAIEIAIPGRQMGSRGKTIQK
jgi:rsbT co-antagonist protein RsbR